MIDRQFSRDEGLTVFTEESVDLYFDRCSALEFAGANATLLVAVLGTHSDPGQWIESMTDAAAKSVVEANLNEETKIRRVAELRWMLEALEEKGTIQ